MRERTEGTLHPCRYNENEMWERRSALLCARISERYARFTTRTRMRISNLHRDRARCRDFRLVCACKTTRARARAGGRSKPLNSNYMRGTETVFPRVVQTANKRHDDIRLSSRRTISRSTISRPIESSLTQIELFIATLYLPRSLCFRRNDGARWRDN